MPLAGSSFGGSLAARSLFGTLLFCSSFSGSTGTSLGSSTFARLAYLYRYEVVNLLVECRLLLALLGQHSLQGLLLGLKRLHHLFLLGVLALQLGLHALSFLEQVALLAPHLAQLTVLVVHLLLLLLQQLSLRTLIGGILVNEPHAAVHLRQALCTEDEQQLVLNVAVARHISHRLYELLPALSELCLERRELPLEYAYVAVDVAQVALDSVD